MKLASDKQKKEWKEKYGSFYEIEVDDKVAYVKAPTMLDWKRSMSVLSKGTETAFSQDILVSNWIGGDDEIKQNSEYFYAVAEKLQGLLEYPDAEIENNGNVFTITIAGKSCKVNFPERDLLEKAEQKNVMNKPFVTEEKLFEMIKVEADEVFNDKNNADYRFPLYQALKQIKNQKVATIKKY